MKKKLSVSGNGWDIHISKAVLKLVGFNPPESKALFTIKNKILFIENITAEQIDSHKDFMVRNFAKSGGGWGLYLPNDVLALLEINPEIDLVDYEVDGRILKIKKA